MYKSLQSRSVHVYKEITLFPYFCEKGKCDSISLSKKIENGTRRGRFPAYAGKINFFVTIYALARIK